MTTGRLSEKFSENKPKGRPRITTPNFDRKAQTFFPATNTRRGLLNKHYLLIALAALSEDKEAFIWLVDPPKFKLTILYELGRVQDPELIREGARQLCALKPTTKRAVQILREVRLENTTTIK